VERAGIARRICWQILVPAAIGAVTGACVAAASAAVEGVALTRLASLPGALPALFSPIALLATLLVSRTVTRAERPATSELYVQSYHHPERRFPLEQVPGRLLAAATTVAGGGSQGFESASAIIGVSFSEIVSRGRNLHVSADLRRSLLAAGASGGIAAVFSSPAVGTLYGIEVPFKRDVDAPRLAPCAVAAVCSYAVRDRLVGAKHLVDVRGLPELDSVFLAACLAVALLCGAGAWLFARAEDGLRSLGRRQTRLQRAAIGGVVLAGLAWGGHELSGAWLTFGPGYIAADWLLARDHAIPLLVGAFAIRASGNLVSVYGGGGGGVFTSLACNGAFLGQIVAELVDRSETRMLPLLGAACFLGSGYRLPIACMLLVAEQGADLLMTAVGLVAVALGQVMMGEESVSEAQVDERGAGAVGERASGS
jgi:CIC family chloride channel protein